MEEKNLTQLIEEEEKKLKELIQGRKFLAYTMIEFMIKELFLLKNMLNEKRLFLPSKEDIARIFVRVYLLSNVALSHK